MADDKSVLSKDKLADLWAQQSQTLWSRLKVASVVEAASLAAAYNLWRTGESFLSGTVLGLSILLLLCVMFLMWRDAEYLGEFQKAAGFERPKSSFDGKGIGLVLIGFLILFHAVMIGFIACRNEPTP